MKRREFLYIGSAAALWPVPAATQSATIYRVGVLIPSRAQWPPPEQAAFVDTLASLGFKEGGNLKLEIRDAEGRLDRLPDLARELAGANLDVMVAVNTPGARAAIGATKTTPIVMGAVGDPVATGFVTNLARPGGNVTGLSLQIGELAAKRLQLLKEAAPAAERIAVLMNSGDPVTAPQLSQLGAAAERLGIELKLLEVRTAEDVEGAFEALVAWRAQAILRLAGQGQAVAPLTIELALRHKLPTMLVIKTDVRAGALMCYDPDRAEAYRQVARYVEKILKGARPGDLPVEQPTRFQLVINLKTAKALGLAVPPALLARADEVIE